MAEDTPRLILASGSQTRAAMLRAAGLMFDVVPASVDEAALLSDALATIPHMTPAAAAQLLARAKAVDVSLHHPDAVVIGGDQVLAIGREMMPKARNRAEAEAALLKLKGKAHDLHSAAALAIAGNVDWVNVDSARLTMRNFSAAFLENYLNQAGPALTSSVGAYQIEGLGLTLFDHVAGSHSTILGLPLLPLLAELRARRLLMS